MAVNHEFPYTNLHDLNIDWILQVVKKFEEEYTGISKALENAIDAIEKQQANSVDAVVNQQELSEDAINDLKLSALSAIQDAYRDAISDIPSDYAAVLAAIAPNFSNAVNYYAGDYVWYDGTLKKFTVDHPAGSWIGADVVNATIGVDVSDLKSTFDDVANVDFDKAQFNIDGSGYIEWESGGVTPSIISSHTDYVDVSNYVEIKYKRQCNTSSSSTTGIAFYNSSKVFISGVSAKTMQPTRGYIEDTTPVPEGAAYARFSTYTDVSTYGVFEVSGKRKIINAIEKISATVESVADDVSSMEGRIFEEIPTSMAISSIPSIATKAGYNASNGSTSIQMTANELYDSYWFVTDHDVDIWVGSITASYFAIVAGNGAYLTTIETSSGFYVYCENGSTRYRTVDNNLPTVNSKLHVAAGCPIAFTITAGEMQSIYGLDIEYIVKDSFKAQIAQDAKTKYIKYVSGSGADSSTERVEIYIPTKVGYVRYDFLHCEKDSRNCDIWRIGYAYAVSDAFAERYALTVEGEWEFAMKKPGQSTPFAGGYEHGNESVYGITFILDGSAIDITDYTELTPFEQLSIFENSSIYDPEQPATKTLEHGSEHYFDKDGLRIKQSIKYLFSGNVAATYMAMLPIAKAVSDTVVPNSNFVPLSAENDIRIYNTDYVVIYKTNGNVKATFSVPVFEYLTDSDYKFLCIDNNSPLYNKCYFVNTLSNVAVTSGKIIESETRYNFDISG